MAELRSESRSGDENERVRQYLEIAAVVLVALDSSGNVTYINRRGCDLLGAEEEGVVGNNWFADFVPQEWRQRAEAAFQRIMAGDVSGIEVFENPVMTEGGEERVISWNNTALRDEEGGVVGTLGCGTDVTERKRAEEALRESETKQRAIFETAVDGILVTDEEGFIQSSNPACARLFGYAAADLIGKNVTLLMPSPYRENHEHYIRNYLATGEKRIICLGREVVGLRKDATTFPMQLAVSEFWVGGTRMFTGVVHDISSRKAMEGTLQRRLRQLEIVAELGVKAASGAATDELMNEAVSLVAETLEVQYCNVLELLPDGQNLLLRAGVGWPEGLVGQRTVEAKVESQAGYTLNSQEPVIVEDLRTEKRFRATELLQEYGVVSGLSVVILGEKRPFGVLGVHTSRRRRFTPEDASFVQSVANVLAELIANRGYQKELIARESLARLGEMSAVVAHEVKNPLAGIGGALRIIGEGMPADSPHRSVIQDMLERLDSLNNFVNDVLHFARPRSPEMTSVPLLLLLEDCTSLLSRDPGFSNIHVSLSGADLTVSCDTDLLRRVFLNLLRNAAQALENRGTVRVRIDPGGEISDGSCVISITDDGPGVPKEVRNRIFEPFFSTKTSGTGLGLAIAKRIVEQHSGSIRFEFPGEGGARVVVELPLEHGVPADPG